MSIQRQIELRTLDAEINFLIPYFAKRWNYYWKRNFVGGEMAKALAAEGVKVSFSLQEAIADNYSHVLDEHSGLEIAQFLADYHAELGIADQTIVSPK